MEEVFLSCVCHFALVCIVLRVYTLNCTIDRLEVELHDAKQKIQSLTQGRDDAKKTIESLSVDREETMSDWLALYRHAKANDWIAENMPKYQLGPQ
jgi:cell division protein FtsL